MWWRTQASLRLATRTFATQASENMEVAYRRHGSPTAVLEARKGADATAEAFGPFDVAVRWLAAPINPADVNMIQGTYPIKPELPAIGGNEGVAVVERAGAEVQSLQEGDWVIPRAPGLGTWRNHSVHNYQNFMRVPSDLPVSQVATASINPCTALRLLTDFAELKEGDVVVQNGGNSSVGRCVIQLAAARGIKTVNLVRERPRITELQEELRALGATAVVVKDDAFAASKMIGRAKLGLNCIGGELSTVLAKMLDDGASLVTYGGMSKRPLIVPTSLMIFKDIKCYGFWLTRWTQQHGAEEKEKMMKEVLSLIRNGEIQMGVEEVPLSQFKEGVELAMSAYRSKKVVLKCSD